MNEEENLISKIRKSMINISVSKIKEMRVNQMKNLNEFEPKKLLELIVFREIFESLDP